MNIGFLHPGSMGVSIAAAAISAGHTAFWASEGRGETTRKRAGENGIEDVGTISALCDRSDIICSICPPAAAEGVAGQVAAARFKGIYMDGNAISPERMAKVAAIAAHGGARVVDGGIIGPPAWKHGTTYLYLSGEPAATVAGCFAGSVITTRTMTDRVGDASALKMCYAALTKGTAALLCGIIATAEKLGVRDALYDQWRADSPDRVKEHEKTVCAVPPKAWRWIDEMEEIARTFENAGQPGGFHTASAEIFRRLSSLKDGPHPASLDTILSRLKK